MTISYLFRSAALRRFSIERVFETVMDHLPPGYEAQRWEAPSPRVRPDGMRANMQAAARIQADIAHVTGDIHYVVPALRVNRGVRWDRLNRTSVTWRRPPAWPA